MITMLAHFSCLINIFFLSLSTLILSYFSFTSLQGATMQARAFGSNMKRLKDSQLFTLYILDNLWLIIVSFVYSLAIIV